MERLAGIDLALAYAPEGARAYFEAIVPNGFRLIPQQGADLGQRLAHALGRHFDLGYRRVAIMNSDGPTLPPACLEEAFAGLDRADVTLGPGHDGGYYLIGMKRLHAELFQGITWSTERVVPETLAVCRRLGLVVHHLPEWYDVDVGADLDRLRCDLARDPALAPHTRAFLQSWDRG
jgi:rSAM/selenodomain-associated transferase 1